MLRRGGGDPNGEGKGGSSPGNGLGVRSEFPQRGLGQSRKRISVIFKRHMECLSLRCFKQVTVYLGRFAEFRGSRRFVPSTSVNTPPLNNHIGRYNKTLTIDRLVVTVARARRHIGGSTIQCHISRPLLLKSFLNSYWSYLNPMCLTSDFCN